MEWQADKGDRKLERKRIESEREEQR